MRVMGRDIEGKGKGRLGIRKGRLKVKKRKVIEGKKKQGLKVRREKD